VPTGTHPGAPRQPSDGGDFHGRVPMPLRGTWFDESNVPLDKGGLQGGSKVGKLPID
jgi:hypothetical protein